MQTVQYGAKNAQIHKFYVQYFLVNHCVHYRSCHHKCSFKKSILKNFANFTGKRLCWSLFLIKLQVWRPATLRKETPTQIFSCEIWEIFKNICERLLLALKYGKDLFRKDVTQNFWTLTYCNTPKVLRYFIFEWVENSEQKIPAFCLYSHNKRDGVTNLILNKFVTLVCLTLSCIMFGHFTILCMKGLTLILNEFFAYCKILILVAQLFLFIHIQVHQQLDQKQQQTTRKLLFEGYFL